MPSEPALRKMPGISRQYQRIPGRDAGYRAILNHYSQYLRPVVSYLETSMACLAEFTLANRSLHVLLAASSIAFGLGFGSPVMAGSAAPGTPTPPPQKGVNIGNGPKAPAADDP